MEFRWIIALVLVMAVCSHHQLSLITSANPIGVSYSTYGDNLPSPKDVVALYKKSKIEKIRLYEPSHEILEALRGSNISVCLGIKNEDLAQISSSQDSANAWVNTNVAPYKDDVSFGWITVGNLAIPGPFEKCIHPAMNNIYKSLTALRLQDRIKITTVISVNSLQEVEDSNAAMYRPSQLVFFEGIEEEMTKIGSFIAEHAGGGPLMIRANPYYYQVAPPSVLYLDFALFKSKEPVIVDGYFKYYNHFDALVDYFNAALEALNNVPEIYLAIAETGWPSAGNEPYTSKENAQTYNRNLMEHVLKGGTPRRPKQHYDTFIFSMFNENLAPNEPQRNFGFFYPNMTPVYPFW